MQQDWRTRFDQPKPFSKIYVGEFLRLAFAVGCAVLLIGGGILWATLTLSAGFWDSMGRPRNRTIVAEVRLFSIAFVPLLLEAASFIWYWRKRRKRI